MRKKLAGPGEQKDHSKPEPAIDPAVASGTTDYVAAAHTDEVKNPPGQYVGPCADAKETHCLKPCDGQKVFHS